MERRAGRFRRPRRRVGAGELDERGGSARVRVRARAQPVVVSMSNDDDRLVERPGDDGREVPELDATERRRRPRARRPRGRGARRARACRGTTARRSPRPASPGRGSRCRRPARPSAPPPSRRRTPAEGRARAAAPVARHREHDEQQRERQERREVAGEPEVDGPLDRAAPRPPLARAEAGGLHAGGYSRAGQARTSALGARQPQMPDPSSTILLVDDEDAIQSLLTYPLERDGYRVVQARDGDEALRRFGEETRRPRRARHHAAKSRRARGLPPPSLGEHGADHHAHRPRRRARQGARASSSAPTTTSPSRSRSASSAAACGRCSAARRPRTTRAVATRWSTAARS